jgi:hypothetical protein
MRVIRTETEIDQTEKDFRALNAALKDRVEG